MLIDDIYPEEAIDDIGENHIQRSGMKAHVEKPNVVAENMETALSPLGLWTVINHSMARSILRPLSISCSIPL